MAVEFEGGVVMGADSRTTTGNIINTFCNKGLNFFQFGKTFHWYYALI
jgi:hypothetical protein